MNFQEVQHRGLMKNKGGIHGYLTATAVLVERLGGEVRITDRELIEVEGGLTFEYDPQNYLHILRQKLDEYEEES